MTESAGGEAARPARPRRERPPLFWCALYYCFVGAVFVGADLLHWAVTGHYDSPTRWALYVLEWLSLPGIALAGGAAMEAGSARPPKIGSFILSLALLLMYAWAYDLSSFLLNPPGGD